MCDVTFGVIWTQLSTVVQTFMSGLKSNLNKWAKSLGIFLQSMKISGNFLKNKSAEQIGKLRLFC